MQPLVIKNGPWAGLYVMHKGRLCYVKNEVRPYAANLDCLLLNHSNNQIFYTSSPQRFVDNPNFSPVEQNLQDTFAYCYCIKTEGYMPYCNAVVHAVKNSLIKYATVDNDTLQTIFESVVRSIISGPFMKVETPLKEEELDTLLDNYYNHYLPLREIIRRMLGVE